MIFEGLNVLELASVLAGPSVGQFFAELGATVIKVENVRTQGDVTRTWRIAGEKEDDRSAYFCSVNWGKKSLAVDMSTEEGRKIVHQLSGRSDIIIMSFKPGDAEKLGVDYDSLSRINPGLICGQISGYGAFNNRVGYDAVIQAESGFIDMNGEKNGHPLKMPVALIDVLAGHQLKEGLLLALLKKEKTGDGSLVEISLIQTAIASLVNQASNWLVAGKLPKRQGSAHPNIAPYGDSFETADRKLVLLAVGSDRQFADLCSVLQLNELVNSDHFSTNSKRVDHRELLNEKLTKTISGWQSDTLMRKLNALKVPAGIIQNVMEAFEMPEAKGILVESDGLRGVRSYVGRYEGKLDLLPPPHYGEHNVEVLNSLGYGEEEIRGMYTNRTIAMYSFGARL